MKLKRVLLILAAALITMIILATGLASAALKPDAPVIESSNILSSGKNRITWEKAVGASYYYVYRSKTKSGGYVRVKSTRTLSYTDNDANVGDAYYYCVKSVSADKTVSSTSNKAKLTQKLPRPEVTLSNVKDSGKIQVKWTAIEGAGKYEVYRATSKTGEYRLIKTTTATSMTNTSTEAGKRYYYKVCAVAGNTAASSAFSAACSIVCKLPQPEITLSNISETGKILIEWNRIEGAVSYYVYRSEDKTTWTYVGKSTALQYTDEEAVAGKKYYYRVKAVASSTSANSANSDGKSKTCMLSQPQFIMSQLTADGDIILSWKLVRGANNYRVYRSERKTSGYTRIASVTERTFTDTTVTEGKTYYYKIRAVHSNSAANSVYSVVDNMKVSVSEKMAVSLTRDDTEVPLFIWSSVEGASAYKVYRSLYADKGFSLLSTRIVCNYKNTSIPKGLTFYYKIVATDASGAELASTRVISVTTKLNEQEVLKNRYVNQLVVNLYTLPDINSQALPLRYMAKLELGSCVLSRTDGNWYRVFRNGELYYLRSGDINETLTATKSSFSYTGATAYHQEVIDLAVDIAQNWKTTYAHEQSNGISDIKGVYGFDCSGFVKYVLVSIMQKYIPVYDLSADVETLYATEGIYNSGYAGELNAKKVAIDKLQPGDVLFFRSLADGSASTEIGHCGIYLGNNEFAHSTSSWNDAVCIVPLSGSYLENYAGARRFLPDEIKPANTTKYMLGDYYNYNLYSDHTTDSEVIGTLTLYDKVTVLYTDNGNWAYVETEKGKKGYVLAEYLGDYVYLDYVELKGALNEENKPSLKWNKVANAVKYEIYRSLEKNSGYSLISSTSNTYYVNRSALSGLDLYYKVKAYGASGAEIDTSDFVKITTPWDGEEELLTRYVKLPQLKLYDLPTTSSKVTSLGYMEEVKLGGLVTSSATGSWYRVFYNDRLMYLWQGEDEEKLTSIKSSFTYEGNTQYQQQVIDLALEIYNDWDTVYATGQSDGVANSDGTYGFNAPGLVKYVLNSVMQKHVPTYNLSVVLETLYKTDSVYNYGYEGEFCVENIALESIQPGDVLFFGSGSAVSYCGIYLGNGEFISCLSSWDGVDIMPLADKYINELISIRRYLPENVTPANTIKYILGDYYNYKLYSERSAASEVIGTLTLYDWVTVLYTDTGKWAYIETEKGEKGYVLKEYLGDYTYLDYVELEGELNEENNPYLTWNRVANAVKYDVYRSVLEDSEYSLISSTEKTYYTNPSAIGGLDLYYKVVAYDASGAEIDTSDFVKITTPWEGEEEVLTRYVKAPHLNLNNLPTTSSEVVPLRYMEEILLGSEIISKSTGSWYRVFYNGKLLYLWQGADEEKLTSVKSSFTYEGYTQYQQQVIDLALDIYNNWDTVYAEGQSNGVANPDGTYGFNAPGFAKYVLNSVMQKHVPTYNLSADLDTLYTTQTLYNYGYEGEFNVENIALESIQPGDVLFFDSGSAVSYCGIYLGNGEFISCLSSWDDGVDIMPLADNYAEELISIRRYLPENVTPANTIKYILGDYYNYNLYSERSTDSEITGNLKLYDWVNVLYTDNGSWAYVETEKGEKGYAPEEYLGDYTYLDYVELEGELNEENNPYLTWNRVANAVKYDVYRSVLEGSEYSLVSSTENTYYVDINPIRGLDLYYKVVAFDAYGAEIDSSDCVKITTPWVGEEELLTRYVNLPQLKLYDLPTTSSNAISLRYMEDVESGSYVLSTLDGDWYRAFKNGNLYYLCSKDINETLNATKSSYSYTGFTAYQQQTVALAVDIAQNWKTIYASGQSDGVPDINGVYGFDCSGFVKYVLNSVMQQYVPVYNLSGDVATLYATTSIYNSGYAGELNAIKVNIDELQPGDVLFFKTLADGSPSTEIGHCGIYLGNNEFAHSTSLWDDAVCIVPLSDSYLEGYAEAIRYLPENVTPANTIKYILGDYYNYKLYSERSAASEVIGTLTLYDWVTVLYTDTGKWAYIETEKGEKGYVLKEYLGDYTYLDYVELEGTLNETSKPYLTWNRVANAVKYDIYRSLKADSDYSLISSTEKTYYTNLSATSGLDLYYKVVALDASGVEIDTSDFVRITTPLEGEEELLTRYVKLTQLKLYDLPATSSDAISVGYMEEVLLGSQITNSATGSWYRVFYNDKLMYLWQGADEEKLTSVKSSFTYEGYTQYQQQVIDLALDIYNNWDTVYATGQSDGVANPDGTYGFNAPGFVKYVLNSVMQKHVPTYNLSVVLAALYTTESVYNYGYDGELRVENIALENIQPGDILFFGADSQVGYCGMYLGNGEFISCLSSWSDGVGIMPLSDKYDEELISIRRYLPENITPANATRYMVGQYYNYNLYSDHSPDSEVIGTLALYDKVTVLYTDSSRWAYIEAENGVKGYVLEEYLGDYVYLDHLELEGSLNEENKPFLLWNKVANAVKYDVYRSLKADSEYSLISSTENTYYSNLSAISGVDLYYKVVAYDAHGAEIDTSDYVKITTPWEGEEELLTRYVKLPQLKLYDLPTTTADITSVRYMEELQLGGLVTSNATGSWYRAFYNDELMYLWQGIADEEKLTSIKSSFTYEGNTQYQQQVIDLTVDIAQNWETTYAHGQSNGVPDINGVYGFDCSGLVKYVFGSVMKQYVPLYNLSADVEKLYATEGLYNSGYAGELNATKVDIDELQPGDVLFFKSLADGSASTEIGHCGIYLGNNEFAHSTSFWSDSVCIVSLAGSYLENYVGAIRYLPEKVTPANEKSIIEGPYKNYKVYAEKSADSTVIATPALGDTVTILFTDCGSWAYVETTDGTKGYMLLKYLP